MKHVPLRFVPDAAVPLGYGVLVGAEGVKAAKTASTAPHPYGVSETFVWEGPWRERPGAAISDAWIHATGSEPARIEPKTKVGP